MTNDKPDPVLLSVFADAGRNFADDEFTTQVMIKTDKLKRGVILRRIGIAIVVGIVSIPVQDYGLALSHILMMSLLELDNQLASQLLAPINTVGGALSVGIFAMRAFYRKLFQ